MQTIQQQRAAFALEKVTQALQGLQPKARQEFKSYAKSLPVMIHMNGLGQAAAFHKAKGGQHALLYQMVSEWLGEESQPFEGADLLQGIVARDMGTYLVAQAEAIALSDWIKRFAEAMVEDDTPGGEGA